MMPRPRLYKHGTVTRSFTLSLEAVERIESEAKRLNTTKSQALVNIIERDREQVVRLAKAGIGITQ